MVCADAVQVTFVVDVSHPPSGFKHDTTGSSYEEGLCIGGGSTGKSHGRDPRNRAHKMKKEGNKYTLTLSVSSQAKEGHFALLVNCGDWRGKDIQEGKCVDGRKHSDRYYKLCDGCTEQTVNVCLGDAGNKSGPHGGRCRHGQERHRLSCRTKAAQC